MRDPYQPLDYVVENRAARKREPDPFLAGKRVRFWARLVMTVVIALLYGIVLGMIR